MLQNICNYQGRKRQLLTFICRCFSLSTNNLTAQFFVNTANTIEHLIRSALVSLQSSLSDNVWGGTETEEGHDIIIIVGFGVQ